MHRWFMIPEHIMGVFSILIFIIFVQGVCIKKLIKAKKISLKNPVYFGGMYAEAVRRSISAIYCQRG